MKEDYRKSFFQILIVVALIIANLVALKVGEVYGLIIYASVCVYPLTYLGVSVLNDFYGRKTALKSSLMAIVFQLLVLIPYYLVIKMPVQSLVYDFSGEVETVFAFDSSIVVSSLIAFTVGQLVNIYIFDFMKKNSYKMLGAALGILFGLIVDGIIFTLLAGWGMPQYAMITRIYSQITSSVFATVILSILFALSIYYPYFRRKKRTVNHDKREDNDVSKKKVVKKNTKR